MGGDKTSLTQSHAYYDKQIREGGLKGVPDAPKRLFLFPTNFRS